MYMYSGGSKGVKQYKDRDTPRYLSTNVLLLKEREREMFWLKCLITFFLRQVNFLIISHIIHYEHLMRPEFGPIRLIFANRKTVLSVSFDLFKNMAEWAIIYKGSYNGRKT